MIQDDMIGPGASIGFGETETYRGDLGVHDQDTILVDTQSYDQGSGSWETDTSLESVAGVVAHEYGHVMSARSSGMTHDPLTKGECGHAEHARMHYEQVADRLCGGGPCGASAEEREAFCKALYEQMQTGEKHEAEDAKGGADCGAARSATDSAKQVIDIKYSYWCPPV